MNSTIFLFIDVGLPVTRPSQSIIWKKAQIQQAGHSCQFFKFANGGRLCLAQYSHGNECLVILATICYRD